MNDRLFERRMMMCFVLDLDRVGVVVMGDMSIGMVHGKVTGFYKSTRHERHDDGNNKRNDC
jgi:hypothetical protein